MIGYGLGIVSALATNKSSSFNDSKRLLKTDGRNLIAHARKLEDARYITSNKFFDGRIPRTNFRRTASGRKALDPYLSEMEVVIRHTGKTKSTGDLETGWPDGSKV